MHSRPSGRPTSAGSPGAPDEPRRAADRRRVTGGGAGTRRPERLARQTTIVIRSEAISCGLVTESNETTLTWLLPNLSWAWFLRAPSW